MGDVHTKVDRDSIGKRGCIHRQKRLGDKNKMQAPISIKGENEWNHGAH